MTFQALLFCPDERTARVTTQVLNELEFSVEACNEPFAAVKKLMAKHFDAVVVDCENEQNASLLFKSARNSAANQGALAVAVVEGQAGVANAFRVGANLVLTKPINVEQAKSTLRVARGLLRKGSDTKGNAASAPTAATIAPPRPTGPATRAPSAPLGMASKPAVPAAQKPKSEHPVLATTKSSLDAEDLLETTDEDPAASQSAEESLFESPELGEAPTTPPSNSRPAASQEHTWQPVSKPAGAMASSLQRALENAGQSSTPAPAAPRKPAPKSAADPEPSRPSTIPVRAPGGAASAPALALEATRTTPALFAGQSAPPEQFPSAIAAGPAGMLAEPPEPLSAPSFAALDLQEGGPQGSGKKWILIAVLVAAFAVAAYFGYTKFVGNKQAPLSVPVPSQPQPAVPSETQAPGEEMDITVGGPAGTAQARQETIIERTPVHTPSGAKGTTIPAASRPLKTSADEPEVTVTHADAEKLVVKSDVGTRVPSEPAETVAPPALGSLGAEDSNALPSVVKSATVSVPKVAPPQGAIKVSQGVTQGLILKRVQPTYPHQALQMRVHGTVLLQAEISKAGNITNVKVLSGEPILARAAVQAVNQWKYKPYYLNGEPVDIQTQITVNFRLPNE